LQGRTTAIYAGFVAVAAVLVALRFVTHDRALMTIAMLTLLIGGLVNLFLAPRRGIVKSQDVV
jgi:hypothetical protein